MNGLVSRRCVRVEGRWGEEGGGEGEKDYARALRCPAEGVIRS